MRDGGVIFEDHELIDQHGEVAQGGRFTFLVAKRSAEPVSAGSVPLNSGGQTT